MLFTFASRLPVLGGAAAAACVSLRHALQQQTRGMLWSVEREKHHTYKPVDEIINDKAITEALESTKAAAKDPAAIKAILQAASDRAMLKNAVPELMGMVYDTALAIKERIYGNRIVLFAPLYLANYCVNSCTYCAFRSGNKSLQRSALTDADIVSEVTALQEQGHRRILALTGEHPKYTFDQFLHIPSLSVSDVRRLKATDHVGTFTLFQETYHRPTFAQMHVSGPKSDYDHRLLSQDRAMLGGIDDVGIGALFGLADYRYEVLGMLSHANHLEDTYGAGPHTISVPRMRPADGSELSIKPPHEVDDANFIKLVAILRVAVPYTGMILSTRESPAMRDALLAVGMSQMSAGSRTDVGAYHRHDSEATNAKLGDLTGQFSLMDHRPASEIVKDLMRKGYVPSWCTACYRKGRTGEAFMKIAKAGEIHNFCHPNSLLTLQEYLNDYADPEARKLGAEVMAREAESGLSDAAKRLLQHKLKRVNAGEHDVYI
ncbi:hypothetical protein Rsub_02263 [Raphidocelis subcapitata]|uniref:Biotin and thiamin synthesis-associated domain-containing protein n=1 Tax=Raphidocelis subcapitata TaxID=307507 RepID=A0A2V0NXJ4_9CHLO|nr:hypothetical protein Rsub_02263 [Raphidocelis subcapitata]|eukprot:GBF89545.1 hypothetical protein Rsub_02263 [Raphidocelis subcapitata]